MGISDIFCITGWLAILFSKNALWLDLGRFLVGCGSGVSVYVVPVYVAEITTKDIRGAFSSLNVLMLACGKALMYVIASLINWRTSALIGDQKFCFLALYGKEFLTDGREGLSDDEDLYGEKDHAGEDGFCFVRFGTLEFQQHVENVGDTKRQKLSGYKVVNSNLKNIPIADFTLNLAPLEFCSKSGTFSYQG
ncbi:General substrate transporter [Corchorus capsularis]|uniref:General substrate transporter n=1 Tax=Corchorus capsularis TaxID=210143 RepID=A0A1R3KL84_COCAP|nr:General substrate transporter [Corchorus capsularis]